MDLFYWHISVLVRYMKRAKPQTVKPFFLGGSAVVYRLWAYLHPAILNFSVTVFTVENDCLSSFITQNNEVSAFATGAVFSHTFKGRALPPLKGKALPRDCRMKPN